MAFGGIGPHSPSASLLDRDCAASYKGPQCNDGHDSMREQMQRTERLQGQCRQLQLRLCVPQLGRCTGFGIGSRCSAIDLFGPEYGAFRVVDGAFDWQR